MFENTSLNTFKNKFTSVRATLFRVFFSIPDTNIFLKNNFIKRDKITDIYIYCKNASLPSMTIQESLIYYYGRLYSEASDRVYDPLDITFYNSQDFAIRNFIELWIEHINKSQENQQIDGDSKNNNYNYFTDIQIDQLDRRNNVIKSYFFRDCYPISCSMIPLDYTQQNAIEEFTVSFRYQWFDTKDLEKDVKNVNSMADNYGQTLDYNPRANGNSVT